MESLISIMPYMMIPGDEKVVADRLHAVLSAAPKTKLLAQQLKAWELSSVLIVLDGTPNKSRLGGNALVAVSMAVLHAAAAAERRPLYAYLLGDREPMLPLPEIQIFGGGVGAAQQHRPVLERDLQLGGWAVAAPSPRA